MWEIWSQGRLPYSGMTNQLVVVQVPAGHRLPHPYEDCPKAVYALMLRCWDADNAKRPTFAELKRALGEILAPQRPSVKVLSFPTRRSTRVSADSNSEHANTPGLRNAISDESSPRESTSGIVDSRSSPLVSFANNYVTLIGSTELTAAQLAAPPRAHVADMSTQHLGKGGSAQDVQAHTALAHGTAAESVV
jgi:hypothetical protein